MTWFNSDMEKKVLKNLEKSIFALPIEEADSLYDKTKINYKVDLKK